MRFRSLAALVSCLSLTWLFTMSASAGTFNVSTEAELANALNSAQTQPNSEIIMAPGTYVGKFSASGVVGLTLRSSDPSNAAIIDANSATEGLKFSDPNGLILRDLEVRNASGNGINIDDGGTFATPARDVTIRNVTVRNTGGTGNEDGIKLSGVVGFHVDRARVIDWGRSGSAIDPVGSSNGLIENSLFNNSDDVNNPNGSGVRPKGGSSNIIVRANRLVEAGGRAIQAGGNTDASVFRPPLSSVPTPYTEADGIITEGNVIVGGSAGVSWVNTTDGTVRNNVLYRQRDWAMRILNEHSGDADYVETAGGVFNDNIVLWNDGDISNTDVVNIGINTQSGTFAFARNQWFNQDTPGSSQPTDLPTPEVGGIYGVDPGININDIVAWDFDWGLWLVNANDADNGVTLSSTDGLFLATADPGGSLDLGLADPFVGAWTFTALDSPTINMAPLSQTFVTTAPEPATIWLWVLASLAAVAWARRPRKRAP